MNRWLLLCTLLAAPAARAIVLYGGDQPANEQPPPNGAPWKYVAKVGDPDGSGVYLGKRFIITANHVTKLDFVMLNGKTYQRDASFVPKQIGGRDIKLFRILGDPALPGLPLIASTDSEFLKACTVIGWGMGRGVAVPGQGWLWNDLRRQRWGTNITSSYIFPPVANGPVATSFNRGIGPNEMSLANTDSGCGMFINFGGVWKLVAIGNDVDDNAAYYDRDLTTPGLQPTHSYYVRLRPVRATILAIIAAAAP